MVSTPKSVGDALKAELGGTVNITLDKQYIASVPYTDPADESIRSRPSPRAGRAATARRSSPISARQGRVSSRSAALTGSQGAQHQRHLDGRAAYRGRDGAAAPAAPDLDGRGAQGAGDEHGRQQPARRSPPKRGALPAHRASAPAGPICRARPPAMSWPTRQAAAAWSACRLAASRRSASQPPPGKVQVANKGATPVTYNLAYVPATTIPGVSYTLSAPSVTIGAGPVGDGGCDA